MDSPPTCEVLPSKRRKDDSGSFVCINNTPECSATPKGRMGECVRCYMRRYMKSYKAKRAVESQYSKPINSFKIYNSPLMFVNYSPPEKPGNPLTTNMSRVEGSEDIKITPMYIDPNYTNETSYFTTSPFNNGNPFAPKQTNAIDYTFETMSVKNGNSFEFTPPHIIPDNTNTNTGSTYISSPVSPHSLSLSDGNHSMNSACSNIPEFWQTKPTLSDLVDAAQIENCKPFSHTDSSFFSQINTGFILQEQSNQSSSCSSMMSDRKYSPGSSKASLDFILN